MAMDVTLRQLRAYVAVLESASFSEAAKAMHLSQAALSGLIKELETRVGVRLLDRTTRKVSASAVGETFAPMARRVLSNLDEALDSLTNLTDRLTELLNPANQRSMSKILENTDRMTKSLADASPRVDAVLAQLQATLAQADLTLAQFQQTLGTTDQLLNREGPSLADELRKTLVSARKAADSLQATMEDTRPAARELSQSTLPAAEAAMRDLRRTTEALRQMTESIQNQGAGSLIKGKQLPDYKP